MSSELVAVVSAGILIPLVLVAGIVSVKRLRLRREREAFEKRMAIWREAAQAMAQAIKKPTPHIPQPPPRYRALYVSPYRRPRTKDDDDADTMLLASIGAMVAASSQETQAKVVDSSFEGSGGAFGGGGTSGGFDAPSSSSFDSSSSSSI